MKIQKPVEFEIEKLVYQGDGLGRAEGMVYFAPWTAPGDRIQPTRLEKKKNLCKVHSFKMIQESSTRRKAPCPVFGECGGCQWQHVLYEEQLRQKQQMVLEQLRKVLGDAQILPIISGPEWQYRNRIQVHVKSGVVGFHKRGSSEIVTAEYCQISDPRLLAVLPQLKTQPDGRYEIYLQDNGEAKLRSAKENEERENSSFHQVNTFVNQELLKSVAALLPADVKKLYDLYAGAGNFTFSLLQLRPEILQFEMVELSAKLCHEASLRLQSEGLQSRVRVHQSTVDSFIRRTELQNEAVVLLDPPRPGLNSEICTRLNGSKCQEMIYISCNPAALARDLQQLPNYRVEAVQVFDMFPQTFHVETLAKLQLK